MKKAIIFIAWVLITTVCYTLITFTMGDYSLPFIFPYVLLGFSQWMIISKRGRISAWFILVSSVLWAVSYMMSIAPVLMGASVSLGASEPFRWDYMTWVYILIYELILGAIIGFLQWLFLRRRFIHSGWWILAYALGWAVGFAVLFLTGSISCDQMYYPKWLGYQLIQLLKINQYCLLRESLPFGLAGAILGVVTGITLVLLPVRKPETEIPAQTPDVAE